MINQVKEKVKEQSEKEKGRLETEDTRAAKEFEQKIVDLARVTRVMAGGKRLRFRACVLIGNHQGKVGMGLAKGADVTLAVNKAVNQAEKSLLTVAMVRETIPHEVTEKYGAAKILIKPAPKGTGIIAGGAARQVLELAGVPNIVAKILGSNNKINNVRATLLALSKLKLSKKSSKK
ncbi:MAG: 30S ribosomal protein S5 [Candidatus Buchananbacteria bacterium]